MNKNKYQPIKRLREINTELDNINLPTNYLELSGELTKIKDECWILKKNYKRKSKYCIFVPFIFYEQHMIGYLISIKLKNGSITIKEKNDVKITDKDIIKPLHECEIALICMEHIYKCLESKSLILSIQERIDLFAILSNMRILKCLN